MKTIDKDIDFLLEVKNSKFYACLRKINSINDINIIMDKVRQKYPNAKHYPYAYIIDNNVKCSDDKEPSNTAGVPLLEVLKKNNLNYVIVIVVRYFGGTLLGAGLLTRTYANSVKEALKQIKFKDLVKHQEIELSFNYNIEKDINNILKNEIVFDKIYTDKIIYKVYIDLDRLDNVLTMFKSYNIDIILKTKLYIEK